MKLGGWNFLSHLAYNNCIDEPFGIISIYNYMQINNEACTSMKVENYSDI